MLPYLPLPYLLPRIPYVPFPSPSLSLFITLGREGRVGGEIPVLNWLLPCPTSALPVVEVGHGLICPIWSPLDA